MDDKIHSIINTIKKLLLFYSIQVLVVENAVSLDFGLTFIFGIKWIDCMHLYFYPLLCSRVLWKRIAQRHRKHVSLEKKFLGYVSNFMQTYITNTKITVRKLNHLKNKFSHCVFLSTIVSDHCFSFILLMIFFI